MIYTFLLIFCYESNDITCSYRSKVFRPLYSKFILFPFFVKFKNLNKTLFNFNFSLQNAIYFRLIIHKMFVKLNSFDK